MSFHDPSSRVLASQAISSQDDLATISRPSRPSVELVSRAAKRWVSGNRNNVSLSVHRRASNANSDEPIMRFEPWDFSEVALATDEVRSEFQRGSARAERPPREGVCGTYFIRNGKGEVLCVFKPIDEEATDIEMSPPPLSPYAIASPFKDSSAEFSLGPAHENGTSTFGGSPVGSSHGETTPREGSVSSTSDDYDSRTATRMPGFMAGEGAYKEVAAYLLDHSRFARVPQTALATCRFSTDLPEKNKGGKHIRAHSILTAGESTFIDDVIENLDDEDTHIGKMKTKIGALQVFVENVGDADEFGAGVFDMDQVHRIAVLDIRTLNHDRHGGNILVAKSSSPKRRYNLIPIDHGYILPDGSCECLHSIPWPIWMDWPMVRKPVSDRVKSYIEHLDAEAEAHILDNELDGNLRAGSLQTLKIATMLLQKGVAAGLTLYDIGLLIYSRREDPSHLSELGKIIMEAHDAEKARHHDFSLRDMAGHPPIPLSFEDHHHRRHQSMSALHIPEMFREDYVVKYAGRRIQEVVRLAVAKKQNQKEAKGQLLRSRSIPDFGIGVRPLHMLGTGVNSLDPAPTPVSSPVATRMLTANQMLEAQIFSRTQSAPRQAPIRVPINDGSISRIEIPEFRSSPVSDSDSVGLTEVAGKASSGADGMRVKKLGSIAEGALPPLFKAAGMRKTSPVATQEMASGVWDSDSV